MAHAVKADLEAYAGESVTLPSDDEIDRLLDRASELIDEITMLRCVDADNDDHTEARKLATCAQAEYWLQAGEPRGLEGSVQSYSVGSVQVTYGAGNRRPELASRARRHLMLAGLLYRGVTAR